MIVIILNKYSNMNKIEILKKKIDILNEKVDLLCDLVVKLANDKVDDKRNETESNKISEYDICYVRKFVDLYSDIIFLTNKKADQKFNALINKTNKFTSGVVFNDKEPVCKIELNKDNDWICCSEKLTTKKSLENKIKRTQKNLKKSEEKLLSEYINQSSGTISKMHINIIMELADRVIYFKNKLEIEKEELKRLNLCIQK